MTPPTYARPLPRASEVAGRLGWKASTATARMNGSRSFTIRQWLALCDAFRCHDSTAIAWAREIDARADARHPEETN